MSDTHSSTPNWPIVGGEYCSNDNGPLIARVTAIDDSTAKAVWDGKSDFYKVYFTYMMGGKEVGRTDCLASTFRKHYAPEDQSIIPALVAALKESRAWLLMPGKETLETLTEVMEMIEKALTIAGEPTDDSNA